MRVKDPFTGRYHARETLAEQFLSPDTVALRFRNGPWFTYEALPGVSRVPTADESRFIADAQAAAVLGRACRSAFPLNESASPDSGYGRMVQTYGARAVALAEIAARADGFTEEQVRSAYAALGRSAD